MKHRPLLWQVCIQNIPIVQKMPGTKTKFFFKKFTDHQNKSEECEVKAEQEAWSLILEAFQLIRTLGSEDSFYQIWNLGI